MSKVAMLLQEKPLLRIPLHRMRLQEHGAVLCYPGTDLSSFEARIQQLEELGVRELLLEGSSKVGSFGVVGRGCVSIVVKAVMKREAEPVALKIRRVDANRPSMEKDYLLQKFANSFGVGPKVIAASRDFFAMEFVDSMKIGSWLEQLKTRSAKKESRAIVRDMLTQCNLLDSHGLDHGELSNPSKHLLIRKGDAAGDKKTVIIDYESASTQRRPANLTAVGAFLFLGSWKSEVLRRVLRSAGAPAFSKKRLLSLFREYKSAPSSPALERLLAYLCL